jgi:hypothetical protein
MKSIASKLRRKDEAVTSSSLIVHEEPHPGERIIRPQHSLRSSKILGLDNADDEGKKRSKVNKAMIGPVTPADVSAIDSSTMGALSNYSRDNPGGEQ